MKKNDLISEELKRIAESNGGILKAEDVVESAKVETSVLHDCFIWDDTAAAVQYRLYQARNLIRCVVTFEPRKEVTVRAFVSLTPDRENPGGGYRNVIAILENKTHREQMLADAFAELKVFETKYQALTELAEVFEVIRKVKNK